MSDKRTNPTEKPLTDEQLDAVAGGSLMGDTGHLEPRGPARTVDGDPRSGRVREILKNKRG